MQKLTYVIGEDKRDLVKDIQNFTIDFKNDRHGWVQARQYENAMRQVFVDIHYPDGTPFDLTGCNIVYEGVLPDKTHKIYDARHGVILDPVNGQFRFDMPKQAFAVAGSYVQAFFRIMRDGDSVTTLEFDMTVLADKVISGLIPADYITPFEDLYDKLEIILENADTEFKQKVIDWQAQITKLVTDFNGDYQTLVATLNGLQTQANKLVTQINENDIPTRAEINEFETNMSRKITDSIGEFSIKIPAIAFNGRHRLSYKTVSIGVTPNLTVTPPTAKFEFKHLKDMGATATLTPMLNVNNATDPSPEMTPTATLEAAFSEADKAGVPVTMVKPHIGTQFMDWLDRGTYDPSDWPTFFNNWQNVMLQFAALCDAHKVPILCIGCEQAKCTDPGLMSYWKTLTEKIRSQYPDLKLTYAAAGGEFADIAGHGQIAQFLDFMGMNIYPRYTYKTVQANNAGGITIGELTRAFYSNRLTGNKNFHQIVDDYMSTYGKGTFITETGVMPTDDGLVHLISDNDRPSQKDPTKYTGLYQTTALAMQAFFEGLGQNPAVVGFAWWSAGYPFDFFNGSGQTIAELTMKKYIEGGLI